MNEAEAGDPRLFEEEKGRAAARRSGGSVKGTASTPAEPSSTSQAALDIY
jgi:hypothetical protein